MSRGLREFKKLLEGALWGREFIVHKYNPRVVAQTAFFRIFSIML